MNMNMNNFKFEKINSKEPDNYKNSEVIPPNSEPTSESILGIEKKKMDKDPYFDWMMNTVKDNKGKSKEGDTTALSFVKYIINTESKEYGDDGLDKALRMVHEDLYLSYLEPILYTLKGDFAKAKELIIENKSEENYLTTAEALFFLLKKNPNEKLEIMEDVRDQNPGLMDFIKNSYSL